MEYHVFPISLARTIKSKIKEVWCALAKVLKYFTKGSRERGKY